jgi:hypothetical protein
MKVQPTGVSSQLIGHAITAQDRLPPFALFGFAIASKSSLFSPRFAVDLQ